MEISQHMLKRKTGMKSESNKVSNEYLNRTRLVRKMKILFIRFVTILCFLYFIVIAFFFFIPKKYLHAKEEDNSKNLNTNFLEKKEETFSERINSNRENFDESKSEKNNIFSTYEDSYCSNLQERFGIQILCV